MISIKKLLVILSILSAISISNASEEIFLDIKTDDIQRFDTGKLRFENKKINDEDDENYLKPSFGTMKKMFDEDFYNPQKVTRKKEKKFGKNSVGAQYDTTLHSDNVSQTKTIYAKRDLTEKMSVDTSYKTNSSGEISDRTKGTVSLSPEYKFTPKTSIKNTYSRNLGDNSNKGEIQLKYKPFADDRMDMNVGAGQKIYDNGQQSSSQANFSTNFRF